MTLLFPVKNFSIALIKSWCARKDSANTCVAKIKYQIDFLFHSMLPRTALAPSRLDNGFGQAVCVILCRILPFGRSVALWALL